MNLRQWHLIVLGRTGHVRSEHIISRTMVIAQAAYKGERVLHVIDRGPVQHDDRR